MASSKSDDSYISDVIDLVSNSASVRGKKRSFDAVFVGPSSCVCNNKYVVDDDRPGDLSPASESDLEVDDSSHEDVYSEDVETLLEYSLQPDDSENEDGDFKTKEADDVGIFSWNLESESDYDSDS